MIKIVFFRGIIVFFSLLSIPASANDTIIKNVYSNSVFYNFGSDVSGRLYVGSSDGLFEIDADLLKKLNNESGYVVVKKDGIKRATYFGVESNKRYRNILPANYGGFFHQSFVVNDYIYIICNGSLFFYKIKKYKMLMKGKSVRSFSENSIGTYDGIYIYGDRIKLPTYTSGEIFEIDSTFYICYDGLAVYSPNKEIKLYRRINTGETRIANKDLGDSREFIQFNDSSFLITSTSGLHLINSTFTTVNTLFKNKNNEAPIIINIEDSKHQKVVSFASENILYNYNLEQDELYSVATFKGEIIDGLKISNKVVSEYVLLFNNYLSIHKKAENYQEIVSGLNDAHSIISIGKDTVLISTLNGLHLFLLSSNEMSPLLFKGIEFNRGALWINSDSIKLGTTSGYIQIAKNDLLQMFNLKDERIRNETYSTFWPLLIAISIFILILGIVFYLIKIRKSSVIKIDKEVTRIEIEEYIQSNLNKVSIESLREHFNLSNKVLYKITTPDKPGNIISLFRKVKAKELILKGETLKKVSESTGFSISYLRKIKT